MPGPAHARPVAVAHERCRLVFAGRDSTGRPAIAVLALAAGTGPTGATVREYRAALGRDASWRSVFRVRWSGLSPKDRSFASVFPDSAGVCLSGSAADAGIGDGPGSLGVSWSDSAGSFALRAEDMRADFRRHLADLPSDLYGAADPASLHASEGVSSGALSLGVETIRGRVFHETLYCSGASPFIEAGASAGHYGDYDRLLLWDDGGSFWLIENASGDDRRVALAEWIAACEEAGAPRATRIARGPVVARLSMAPLAAARRTVPEAWRVEVPEWGLAGSLRALGRDVEIGAMGAGGRRAVHAWFVVAGRLEVEGRARDVFGAVEHVQD